MNKKTTQLGMSCGTASNKLVKDLLWDLIKKTNQHLCFHCKNAMTRNTFSIEHIKPWLDSHDPIGLFFDLSNITFAHLSCNFSKARKPYKLHPEQKRKQHADYERKRYSKEKRRERYLKTGH